MNHADLIPKNWLDPLLTGPNAVLNGAGPFTCTDIERLLNAIRARVNRATPSAIAAINPHDISDALRWGLHTGIVEGSGIRANVSGSFDLTTVAEYLNAAFAKAARTSARSHEPAKNGDDAEFGMREHREAREEKSAKEAQLAQAVKFRDASPTMSEEVAMAAAYVAPVPNIEAIPNTGNPVHPIDNRIADAVSALRPSTASTPRTDDVIARQGDPSLNELADFYNELLAHARQLECERNEFEAEAIRYREDEAERDQQYEERLRAPVSSTRAPEAPRLADVLRHITNCIYGETNATGAATQILALFEPFTRSATRETHWVPCAERMPTEGDKVLVAWDDGWIFTGHWVAGGWCSKDANTSMIFPNQRITHWMPLPSSPMRPTDGGGAV